MFDYTETFSPMVKPITTKNVLTFPISKKREIQQFDVNNAFLNRLLSEEIDMTQPPGFEKDGPDLCCKLNKTLYGLKQAPKPWFDILKGVLLSLNFTTNKCDPPLFILKTSSHYIMVFMHVDDIIIIGTSKTFIQELITKLNVLFSLKDLGQLDYFLGIDVHHFSNDSLFFISKQVCYGSSHQD